MLVNADVFIGSGGTMTAESALLGVPTISYNAVPNFIEKFLVKKKLIRRESNPQRIVKIIKKDIESPDYKFKKIAQNFSNQMEDPIGKLIQVIK